MMVNNKKIRVGVAGCSVIVCVTTSRSSERYFNQPRLEAITYLHDKQSPTSVLLDQIYNPDVSILRRKEWQLLFGRCNA